MDGHSAKKSPSLETLVIQNITNVNDLKSKLKEIINTGPSYEYDVSSCLKTLLRGGDGEIVLLVVQAVSELAKCEEKRETYASKDIILPIINIIQKYCTSDSTELTKHCCRALGNLCCDCDTARSIILENNGVLALTNLLEKTLVNRSSGTDEIKMFASKSLLNFAIGGQQFCEGIVQGGVVPIMYKILISELDKEDMNDDMVSTCLLVLSVVNENTPEFLFEPAVNKAVLNVLRETANVEISELCLDHLHIQAEHDSVKTLLAQEKGVQLVCRRLELLIQQHEAGELSAEDSEVEQVVKQACDLVIIVLTGDEAMHILYDSGRGETYSTMVRWLDSGHQHLLTTAVLAIGNFARQDDYCVSMMEDQIFDKLLDIFEAHQPESNNKQKTDPKIPQATVTKIQHAVLSALRNLLVPVSNKRVAAKGRAPALLINALPSVEDPHVAYKLLAAIRMLVDKQEAVASLVLSSAAALVAAGRWARGGAQGAAAEAPRLLAWAAAAAPPAAPHIAEVEGCISSLVNMLVVCHSVMQNEAILALTLLAMEALKPRPDNDYAHEKNLIDQLIKSDIGKHVALLVDTNCAKMPLEEASNLLAFLDITAKKNRLAIDYKEQKVHESLKKFAEGRKDLSDNMKAVILNLISTIDGVSEPMES